MVPFYIEKIKNSDGEFTVDDVPILWRKRVENKLAELENMEAE